MKERGKDGSEDDKKYQYCPDGAQGLLLCPAEWIETLARGYRVLNKEFGLGRQYCQLPLCVRDPRINDRVEEVDDEGYDDEHRSEYHHSAEYEWIIFGDDSLEGH